MANPVDEQREAPVAWPALIALAVVALLGLVMIGFDLYEGSRTHDHTNHLVDNSLESVVLVGDLRYHATRLLSVHDPSEVSAILGQIDADLSRYDPLTTEPGEREEYERARAALARLRSDAPNAPDLGAVVSSVDHLVDINRRSAYLLAEQIRNSQERELAVDVAVGAVTLLLTFIVGIVLVRSMRRERALLELHVRSLSERHRELEAFASRVSHDLKGPLSPLRGYGDLLATDERADVQEIGVRVRRSVDRMAGIIDELLALSLTGKLIPGEGRIAEVTREILDELSPELAGADVTLAVGDLKVGCASGMLGQVLRNLVSNSIKYRSPDRRLIVRIDAAREADAVTLAVVDNGVGMDAEACAHAFEPLYRAPGSSRPGHGLGLSIVKRAVESAGGAVALSSVKGEGTTVTVRLPAA